MIEIPMFTSVSPDFVQQIELESKLVTIRLKWNVRNERFHMDFTDALGNTVYGGKVVPDLPLLDNKKGFLEFDGDFIVQKVDNSEESDITYENIGTNYAFYYLTSAEVFDWKVSHGL